MKLLLNIGSTEILLMRLADLVIADLNHRYNATHEKVNWMDNIMHDSSSSILDQQSKVKRTGKSLEWQKVK